MDRITSGFTNYIGELPVYVNPFRFIININFSYIFSIQGDGAIKLGLMECWRTAKLTFYLLETREKRCLSGLPNLCAYCIETFYDSIGDVFEFNVPADQDTAALRKVGLELKQGASTRLPFFNSSQMTASSSF